METTNDNTVPVLADKLKEYKISVKELSQKADVSYQRVLNYVEDQSVEGDVRIVNIIISAIECLIAERELAKEENQRKLNSLLNTEK